MKIYLDSEFRCFTEAAEGLVEAETPFFDGKCKTFIEGYRFIPSGQTWTRADGKEFIGEAAFPVASYEELRRAQEAYLEETVEDMKNALEVLGVSE